MNYSYFAIFIIAFHIYPFTIKEEHEKALLYFIKRSRTNNSENQILEACIRLSKAFKYAKELHKYQATEKIFYSFPLYKEQTNNKNLRLILDDLEKDIYQQNVYDLNKKNMSIKLDIDNLKIDDLQDYEIYQQILNNQTDNVNYLIMINKDIIQLLNVLKTKKLCLYNIYSIDKKIAKALIAFEGNSINLPNIESISNDALKIMQDLTCNLKLPNLLVTEKAMKILINFKAKSLSLHIIKYQYRKIMSNKLANRFVRLLKPKKSAK